MCFPHCSKKGIFIGAQQWKRSRIFWQSSQALKLSHKKQLHLLSPPSCSFPSLPILSPLQKGRRELEARAGSYSGSQEGQAVPDSTGGSTSLGHLSDCAFSLGTGKYKPVTPWLLELISKQDYKCHSCVTNFGDWELSQSEACSFPLS